MDGGRGIGRRSATIPLAAETRSVLDLEDFVDSLDFLGERERARVKLAGDEIFDNLVRHALPLEGGLVRVRAARRSGSICLAFFFRSASFASFASRCHDLGPLFDPEDRRWRGIGLVMCRNLSLDICMRHGSRCDRIFLRFASETAPDLVDAPLAPALAAK